MFWIATICLLILTEIWGLESGEWTAIGIALLIGVYLVVFMGSYLVMWYMPSVVKPMFDFGKEAAQRISMPRISIPGATRPTLRTITKAPIKGTVAGGRGAKTLWFIVRSFYRQRICPLLEYVEPPDTKSSG